MPTSPNETNPERPDCLRCAHFFVTWQEDKPRGCRAYEFKSAEMPADVVRSSSGKPCQLFARKPGPAERTRLIR